MKKLTTGKRQMILRKLTKIAVLFVFAGITTGCEYFEYSDPFPDSYYTDNFIADVGFNVFLGHEMTIPAPDPETGSWDFAYRYTDWDQFDYMRFDLAGPTAVASDFSSVPKVFPRTLRYTAWKWSILFPAGISNSDRPEPGPVRELPFMIRFPVLPEPAACGWMRFLNRTFCSHRQH